MPARVVKPSTPTADEVLVTVAMLAGVRNEVLHRIDEAREEGRADTNRLAAEMNRLDGKVDAVKAELKAELHEVKAELHEVKAELHEVKATVARTDAKMDRMLVLLEAQEARNKVVLDGYASVSSRLDQVEQRLTRVEDTIHHLATARPAG